MLGHHKMVLVSHAANRIQVFVQAIGYTWMRDAGDKMIEKCDSLLTKVCFRFALQLMSRCVTLL